MANYEIRVNKNGITINFTKSSYILSISFAKEKLQRIGVL